MTARRLAWIIPTVLVVAAAAYTAWLVWQVQSELRAAESSATDLQAAWRSQDVAARDVAAADLADQAAAAQGHTDGLWWGALGYLPFVGDDVDAVTAMSTSLDLIASEAVGPLGETVDGLQGLIVDGRVDLDTVEDLEPAVRRAHAALVEADDELAGLDSDGFVGALSTRFDTYADLVDGLRSGLASAETAVAVLPTMAGADGPRNYLLLFQNNAEIRPTGGMPGSWALVHADDGTLSMARQGTTAEFPTAQQPVLPLTDEEVAVYGEELGLYFQDPGFTPDFPRAAELWRAHWEKRIGEPAIDGVVAIDPVALSYLLDGTGPVTVEGVTLSRDNAVEELLSAPYIEKGVVAQNIFFAKASEAIFNAATSNLASPIAFVEGLSQATDERRLLIAAFDDQVNAELGGTNVEGALTGDDGSIPHIDVGLSDLTGSKMSYYLRYRADVDAIDCRDGVQELTGSLTLNQVIAPDEAAALPPSVTGGGRLGTEPGAQYVMVRVYGPYEGTLEDFRLNGRALMDLEPKQLDGRQVASVDVLLSSRKDVVLTWRAETGPGQTGAGELAMTPSIVPGSKTSTFASAC